MDREIAVVFRIPEWMDGLSIEAHVDLKLPSAPIASVNPSTTPALSGPAAMHPGTPEGKLMALFSAEDYGDGSAIPLDKNDPRFGEKSEALREAERRWSKTDEVWIRR